MTSSMRQLVTSSNQLDYFWYRGRDRPLVPARNESRNYPRDLRDPNHIYYQGYGPYSNYSYGLSPPLKDAGLGDSSLRESSAKASRSIRKKTSRKPRHKKQNCHHFLRYATLAFTIFIFIAGAAILGLGIYLLCSDYGARQLSEVLGNDLYEVAAFVLVGAGGILILMSMCGCCGAIRESKFMLGCFIFILSLLILALVAAAAVVFVFRQKMEGDIIHSMEDVLIQKYGVELDKSENRMVTDMWNWLQRELNCCGVTGKANDTTSWAIYKHSSWYKGFETGKPYVPQSCCKDGGDINICTGITTINGPPSLGPPISSTMDMNDNLFKQEEMNSNDKQFWNLIYENAYYKGCYDELVHYIQSHAVIIGVSSIAAVVVMLFGLVFSLYLCRRIDYEEY